MAIFWLLFIPLVFSCSLDNCPQWVNDPSVLNVHMICHSHDDMGWIKTVDDYFTGRTKTLVNVGVEYIYSTVIDALSREPRRRFSFAEVGFLTRWLEGRSSNDSRVIELKRLVDRGQIEFIGGGWVQPDEAAAHYLNIIDQYDLGLNKLKERYGECGKPTVAWQIDPFGHSIEHGNIVSEMGYKALFLSRLHYADLEERKKNQSLEFQWKTSAEKSLFTSSFFSNTYSPPSGFCFDALCLDNPVISDPLMEGYNLPQMVREFIRTLKERAAVNRQNHLLLSMGSDFHFSNAELTFTSLDRLMDEFDSNRIRVFYSTPGCYLKALGNNLSSYPLRSSDTFPYASSEHSFWTGYFTSKPALKRLIRQSTNQLRIAQMISLISKRPIGNAEEKLRRALALNQHHDAITGTSKENVTVDYERRLRDAVFDIQKYISASINRPVEFCEDKCLSVDFQSPFSVTVFNPASHLVNWTLSLGISSRSAVVSDFSFRHVGSDVGFQFDVLLFQKVTKNFSPKNGFRPFRLSFPVSIPPLSYRSFMVSPVNNRLARIPIRRVIPKNEKIFIESDFVRLDFDGNGNPEKWTQKDSGKSFDFEQSFHYYVSATEGQPSGAYIFRPNGTVDFGSPTAVELVRGRTFEEIRQTFGSWLFQTIRLWKNSDLVEFEFAIGPIPKEKKFGFCIFPESFSNPIGKEVITRYTSPSIKSDGVFYTDANGRQIIRRENRNSTEPIAGNYYPIVSFAFVRDNDSQLNVYTDRAEGGGSFGDGNLELMLHRRCFKDDNWGVAEALDEPGNDGRGLIVIGKHWLQMAGLSSDVVEQLNHPLVAAFSPISDKDEEELKGNILMNSLPSGIHLLSFHIDSFGSLRFRIENQNPTKSVIVDLTKKCPKSPKFFLICGRHLEIFTSESSHQQNQNPVITIDLATVFAITKRSNKKLKPCISVMIPEKTYFMRGVRTTNTEYWHKIFMSVVKEARRHKNFSMDFFPNHAWDVNVFHKASFNTLVSSKNILAEKPGLSGFHRLCFYPDCVLLLEPTREPAVVFQKVRSVNADELENNFVFARSLIRCTGHERKMFFYLGTHPDYGLCEITVKCESHSAAEEINALFGSMAKASSQDVPQSAGHDNMVASVSECDDDVSHRPESLSEYELYERLYKAARKDLRLTDFIQRRANSESEEPKAGYVSTSNSTLSGMFMSLKRRFRDPKSSSTEDKEMQPVLEWAASRISASTSPSAVSAEGSKENSGATIKAFTPRRKNTTEKDDERPNKTTTEQNAHRVEQLRKYILEEIEKADRGVTKRRAYEYNTENRHSKKPSTLDSNLTVSSASGESVSSSITSAYRWIANHQHGSVNDFDSISLDGHRDPENILSNGMEFPLTEADARQRAFSLNHSTAKCLYSRQCGQLNERTLNAQRNKPQNDVFRCALHHSKSLSELTDSTTPDSFRYQQLGSMDSDSLRRSSFGANSFAAQMKEPMQLKADLGQESNCDSENEPLLHSRLSSFSSRSSFPSRSDSASSYGQRRSNFRCDFSFSSYDFGNPLELGRFHSERPLVKVPNLLSGSNVDTADRAQNSILKESHNQTLSSTPLTESAKISCLLNADECNKFVLNRIMQRRNQLMSSMQRNDRPRARRRRCAEQVIKEEELAADQEESISSKTVMPISTS